MNNQLLPIKAPADFRLSVMVRTFHAGELTRSQQAAIELFECFDGVWHEIPPLMQDFMLRAFRTYGFPIDYEPLPFWLEKPAKHLFTICYPTLRKSNLSNPTPEDFGKVSGHLLAMSLHAKARTAFFRRLPEKTAQEAKAFFEKIHLPLRVLIDEGLTASSPEESEVFLKGLNHAFAKTFDATTGMPFGWNTNSPALLGICFAWRMIAGNKLTLPALHKELVKALGKNLAGTEDRIKKLCHRSGIRFPGSPALGSQGTTVELDVLSPAKMLPDK